MKSSPNRCVMNKIVNDIGKSCLFGALWWSTIIQIWWHNVSAKYIASVIKAIRNLLYRSSAKPAFFCMKSTKQILKASQAWQLRENWMTSGLTPTWKTFVEYKLNKSTVNANTRQMFWKLKVRSVWN